MRFILRERNKICTFCAHPISARPFRSVARFRAYANGYVVSSSGRMANNLGLRHVVIRPPALSLKDQADIGLAIRGVGMYVHIYKVLIK